jgi:tRNA threonylcarbamoyladenosine biosynthesis protein TsaE
MRENYYLSRSSRSTLSLGKQMGVQLARFSKTAIVAFFGDLGVGKTTWIKGLASSACGIPCAEIHSPTFTYLHAYAVLPPFYHFDLYRIANERAFLHMGFDEYFSREGIVCIEWAERIASILPQNIIRVQMQHAPHRRREVFVTWPQGLVRE